MLVVTSQIFKTHWRQEIILANTHFQLIGLTSENWCFVGPSTSLVWSHSWKMWRYPSWCHRPLITRPMFCDALFLKSLAKQNCFCQENVVRVYNKGSISLPFTIIIRSVNNTSLELTIRFFQSYLWRMMNGLMVLKQTVLFSEAVGLSDTFAWDGGMSWWMRTLGMSSWEHFLSPPPSLD